MIRARVGPHLSERFALRSYLTSVLKGEPLAPLTLKCAGDIPCKTYRANPVRIVNPKYIPLQGTGL